MNELLVTSGVCGQQAPQVMRSHLTLYDNPSFYLGRRLAQLDSCRRPDCTYGWFYFSGRGRLQPPPPQGSTGQPRAMSQALCAGLKSTEEEAADRGKKVPLSPSRTPGIHRPLSHLPLDGHVMSTSGNGPRTCTPWILRCRRASSPCAG